MAANVGKTIITVGVAGAGAYVIYEYTRYSHALSVMDTADPTRKLSTSVDQTLGFFSYLMAGISAPAPGTPAANAYAAVQQALAGTALPPPPPPPGSTPSGPTDTSVKPPPPTAPPPPPPSLPQPTGADLQKVLNLTIASPDQWNYAYRQLTGYGIEQLYGSDFDTVFGAITNGARPTGSITADAFLSLPLSRGLVKKSSISGLGTIARFYTPVVNPMSSLVYRSQHPSPYRFPVSGGMGAFTQATGFEKALWAGRFLRSNRIL
jgi:hypothetical protein